MRRTARQPVAERVLQGVGDDGDEERIVLWLERRPGAIWVVGRSVNGHLRSDTGPRPEDVVFEGHELDEALERANEALEDDVRVLEDEGRPVKVRPFTRKEALPLLERFFFGR